MPSFTDKPGATRPRARNYTFFLGASPPGSTATHYLWQAQAPGDLVARERPRLHDPVGRSLLERDAGRPLEPIIDQINARAQQYRDQSRPIYCALRGFVDEVVRFEDIRRYMVTFAGSAYQNPQSMCPQHQLLRRRLIRSQIVKGQERPKKAR